MPCPLWLPSGPCVSLPGSLSGLLFISDALEWMMCSYVSFCFIHCGRHSVRPFKTVTISSVSQFKYWWRIPLWGVCFLQKFKPKLLIPVHLPWFLSLILCAFLVFRFVDTWSLVFGSAHSPIFIFEKMFRSLLLSQEYLLVVPRVFSPFVQLTEFPLLT